MLGNRSLEKLLRCRKPHTSNSNYQRRQKTRRGHKNRSEKKFYLLPPQLQLHCLYLCITIYWIVFKLQVKLKFLFKFPFTSSDHENKSKASCLTCLPQTACLGKGKRRNAFSGIQSVTSANRQNFRLFSKLDNDTLLSSFENNRKLSTSVARLRSAESSAVYE